MKFEFAQATNITEFAKNNFPDTYEHCLAVFITPDVNDYHILRVLKDFGEGYEPKIGSYLIEHNMLSKNRGDKIQNLSHLKTILEEDDGSNYDYEVYDTWQDVIEEIDGGFGINQ